MRSSTHHSRRSSLWVGTVLAALLLVGCGGDDPESGTKDAGAPGDDTKKASDVLGTDKLKWVIPFEPGGGTDTTSRQLQPMFEEALGGMNITIENVPGGSQAIGTNVALKEGDDCDTIFTQATPHISLSWLLQQTDYTSEDIAGLATVTDDAGVIRVANDARWKTLKELFDDAKKRPGKISFSTSGFSSGNYLALVQLMEATGAKFNIVNFDGGSTARTAVVRGEVDATHAAVYNSLHVADDTRVLAVHADENRWPELTDNAPTVNEALDIQTPPAPNKVAVFVSAECKKNHPERYQVLHDALEQAIKSEEFAALLKKTNEEGKIGYMSGEELDTFIADLNQELVPVIEKIPDLKLVQRPS